MLTPLLAVYASLCVQLLPTIKDLYTYTTSSVSQVRISTWLGNWSQRLSQRHACLS